MPEFLLVALALAFAVVNGANDGGALLSMGLKIYGTPPAWFLVLLLSALVVVPVVGGTAVARTLAQRMVNLEGATGQQALAVAVLAAVAVVAVLSYRGLPTSLTLALVGALAGAGLGSGLDVSWGVVGRVLLIGMLAPMVGAILGFILSHVLSGVPVKRERHRLVGRLHGVAFGAQSFAYAANDGQKIFAVYLVAVAGDEVGFGAAGLLVACFALGSVLGIRRVSSRLTSGILLVRPPNAVIAEFSAAASVLGSAALAAPVSMTQSLAGALVGTGVSESYLRVRWRAAGQLALAWVLTLPASLLAAAGAGWLIR